MSLTHSAGSGSRKGLLLAALILLGWLITLIGLLSLDLSSTAGPRILIGAALALLLRTLLQTGLFIVGHDAMHGVLIPHSRRWNDRFGALALALYAEQGVNTDLRHQSNSLTLGAGRRCRLGARFCACALLPATHACV